MAYELQYKQQRQSFEAWGLSLLRKRTQSEGQDSITFIQMLKGSNDNPQFEEDEDIRVFKDGKQWFRGTNLRPKRHLSAKSKWIEYIVAGPWNRFTRRVYQQDWFGTFTSHLLLNIDGFRNLVSVRATVESVIDYLIARGVEITKGNILSDASETVYPPPSEIVSAPCSAVILNQMRWLLRQGIIYFDYSTDKPTMHVRMANLLPSVTIDRPANDADKKVLSCEIEPRTDLQLPGVWITYEITNQVDGKVRMGLVHDYYPPTINGTEEDVLHLTFSMQGTSITTLEQELEVIDIDAAHADATTRLNWWKARLPYLGDATKVRNLTIAASTVLRETNLPSMVVEGAPARWMEIDYQGELIRAVANYEAWNGVAWKKITNKDIACQVTATDGTSGTYRTKQTEEEGDPIWVGLAQFLYQLSASLQYEGTVRLKESELRLPENGVPRLGTRLNITGWRPEWQQMMAVIQAVDEDAQSGETILTLQPVSTLTASDLVAFLQVRKKRRWTNPLTQNDGEQRDNRVSLPQGHPRENAIPSETVPTITVVATESGATITQDGETGFFKIDAGNGKVATLAKSDANWDRELKVQVVCARLNGVNKLMQVLGSDPYDG